NGTNVQTLLEESTTEFTRLGVGETANTSILGWDDADSMIFGLYSSPTDTTIDAKMTILANGSVGIGTSTPSQLLTIAGNARITGALYDSNNSAGTNGMVLQSTGSGQQWVATSSLNISSGTSISFGADNQIPYTNSGGTDYDYSSD